MIRLTWSVLPSEGCKFARAGSRISVQPNSAFKDIMNPVSSIIRLTVASANFHPKLTKNDDSILRNIGGVLTGIGGG